MSKLTVEKSLKLHDIVSLRNIRITNFDGDELVMLKDPETLITTLYLKEKEPDEDAGPGEAAINLNIIELRQLHLETLKLLQDIGE